MTVVLVEIVLSVLGSTALIFSIYFFGRAIASRRRSTRAVYQVAQQTSRQSAQLYFVLGMALLFFGLVFWGLSLMDLVPVGETVIAPTNTPTMMPTEMPENVTAVPQPTTTFVLLATVPSDPSATESATPLPMTPATVAAPPSPTAVLQVTAVPATDTPSVPTAVVNSGVGVWLRASPSTQAEQLEWVLDDTVLMTVSSGTQSADGFEWQQVRTPLGNEGWVAVDFIVYNN